MAEAKTNGVQAVNRALMILDVFESGDGPLPLAELAQRTGFYKSTLLRLAASLEEHGYLRRLSDGRFMLGPSLMRLGQLYRDSFNLEDYVRPVLRQLVNDTGESATLHVREGDTRIVLYRVDSRHAIRDHTHEGDHLALDRGAAGHVLSAFTEPNAARYEAIRAELAVTSYGERDSETAAVAAPVFETEQRLVGAISLSGPVTRFDDAKVARMKDTLLRATRDLTVVLGGSPEVFDSVLNRDGATH
jgi:DNA-binding IclR family transcriptional regulator